MKFFKMIDFEPCEITFHGQVHGREYYTVVVTVKVIRYVTRPFNLSSTQPTTATNRGTAATAHVVGMQLLLPESLIITALAMDTIGT